MMPDLDVVIPVRDIDRYLGDALESVVTQAELSCTVFVVDAGSERPISLPAAFSGRPEIHLLRSDEPLRAGAARNLGCAAGSAEWISFLDADDVWMPGSRRALLDAAVDFSADLAYGTVVHFHADEQSRRLQLPEDGRKALMAGGVVVRRRGWDDVGPFDPALSSGEFIEWHNRFLLAGLREVAVGESVLRRRLHLDSTSARQIGDRDDFLDVVRRWMSRNA